MSKHIPVLLKEVIEILNPQPGEIAVDCTLGGGGHAEKLLETVGEEGMLIGIDTDNVAAKEFERRMDRKNAKIIVGNFSEVQELVQAQGVKSVDVVLFDFGISSDQLDNPERGFSFQADGPLDMRLNREEQERTAAYLINHASEEDLQKIIREFGEEFNARRIARAIVKRRKENLIQTTVDLFDLIKHALPAPLRFKSGDVARRTFQALRIAVNRELEVIEEGLKSAFKILSPGGRMAAISFHSLEDRIVKQYFQGLSRGCTCPPDFPVCVCGNSAEALVLTRKPLTASEEEIRSNSRVKSAKLRAIKKIAR